jgi:site-specific recombinase XerD
MEPTISSTIDYWTIHLRSEGKRPRTIATYVSVLQRFERHQIETAQPTELAKITTRDVQEFIAHLQRSGFSSASVSLYFRSLRPFFKWLVSEDELPTSPMERMKAPTVEVNPVPVLDQSQVERLFNVVSGTSFEDRRDNAILRVLYDCGIRRGEVSGLKLEDVNLTAKYIEVAAATSKSKRGRIVPFGDRTAKALMRYLRHPRAPREAHAALWMSRSGEPLSDSGVFLMIRRRGQAVGLPKLHPHQFRHSWAHEMMSSGHSEGDVMVLGGWSDRSMLSRYGASAAAERARLSYRSPGDRL